ncbi:Uncharacterized protein, UPF0548 family [Blastococcus aggregatus]|uniref:Uncharacterized protein, UPF0548 family n=1 Tax=Blastococcus aggregatus TaxID=38502 RepID=A0A285UYJ3_9ACTN|nr:DUF1990 domain-containing protein [Blastococcus aggregatus]SOC46880.1 Uncharacterized protein, UPF0548 family [Blastococcus aggregatus]
MGLLRATDPAGLVDAPFNYPEVGATGEAELPAGYRTGSYSAVVGAGRADFERAAAAVFDWRAQRSVGFRVRASGPAGVPGTVVVLTAGFARLGHELPCRVVWAQTGGDERGFSYGTLAGHPESGEERFTLRLLPDGDVVYEIRVFFRLASRAARLAGPLSLGLQRLGTRRYLTAIGRAARG